ncbi:hypothetical protein RO865_17985 [Blautia faecis]|jgi:hypothetical protein|uniref:hypothetical protein n=1 Tax=Blautia faecis TaxID=871665 RepID=UPI002063C1FB|nr:hypothetical protein [Blautia faecis]MDT4370665.1 hypothetical protein [Blautia faecis]DAR32167.1 MAG TPA: hypothetical protein [Caudoviricetes sp.]DAX14700.1 MAG TPA: hypothetical protein [Bacteriophage sp.]
MERLTLDEAIKHAKEVADMNYNDAEKFDSNDSVENYMKANCIKCAEEHEQLAEWLEELKSYKDLEEQGLLVRLPCKVGDTMYDIVGKPLRIVEHKVDAFHIDKKGFHLQIINGVLEKKQEAKVYFSREEAEKKLEKMKNEI